MERKDQWRCPECINKQPKKGNINTPVRGSCNSGDIQTENITKVTSVRATSDSPQDNITFRSKKNSQPHQDQQISVPECGPAVLDSYGNMIEDLKKYMTDLIHQQMDGLREAITSLTRTIQAQNTRIDKLEARVENLEKTQNETQCQDVTVLENALQQLRADIAEKDQALLTNDIEIAGCTEVANENCVHIVLNVAKKIGVEIDERDVINAERVGPPLQADKSGANPRTRPLVVRLARRATRDRLLQAARTRRNLTTEGLQLPSPPRALYLNERLTTHYRHLLQKARELARNMQYKYVWTRDGKIFVRQEQGKPRHRLRNGEDLQKVFGIPAI